MRGRDCDILLILLDGAADCPAPSLDGDTPLEAADTQNLDRLATAGIDGTMHVAAPGVPLSSDRAHARLFGYDPVELPGRGVLEARGFGCDLEPWSIVYSASFATLDGSQTANHHLAADAAVLPIGSNVELDRAVDAAPLDGTVPKQPFGGQGDDSNERRRIWTLAAAFLGDDLADADRLGRALGDAYAGLDGSPITIGKGHAVQVSGASGGDLWLEHFRPTRSADADGDDVIAANVDVLHAFPTLSPATQARIAVLNACNDVHAVGAPTRSSAGPPTGPPVSSRVHRAGGRY